jgi:hypothetical protein
MQMFDSEPNTSQAQHFEVGPPTSLWTSTNHNSSKRACQQPILKYYPAPILNEEKIKFHSFLLEFQAEANLPESFVNWRSFRRLIKFYNVEAAKALPTRQLLGGPILNKYADKVDSGDHAALKVAAPLGSRKVHQLPIRRLGKYHKNAHSRCHSVIGGPLRHVRHIHLWKLT